MRFTQEGLTPSYACYTACESAWTGYVTKSLFSLINNGTGKPTPRELTVQEVATRFNELAQQEKWFEIHDELFSDDVVSIDPSDSPYMGYAEGRAAVRQKGEDFVRRITALHGALTSAPVVSGDHFAVGRTMDITVEPHGRVRIDEIMLYRVRFGQIVSEQFFY